MDGEHIVTDSPTVTELAEAEEEQIDIEGDEDIPVLQEESSQHAAEVDDAYQHAAADDDAAFEQSHEEHQYQEEPADDDPAAGDVSHADEAAHETAVVQHEDGTEQAQAPAADDTAAAVSKPEQLEEWQRMNIPHEWLPSPTFRVRLCSSLLSDMPVAPGGGSQLM
jgi:hypothetical protein